MTHPLRLLTACLFASLLLPSAACAQVGRIFVAVETYVGLARVVHVGRIVEFKPIEYDKPLTSTQKIGKPYRVVFEVSETIRGDAVKRLELVLSLQTTHFLDYMREQSAQIMLVGGPNRIDSCPAPEIGIEEQGKRVDGDWYQFRLLEPLKIPESENQAATASQLNTYYDSCRMFTNELQVITGRDAILKRARAFARENAKPLSSTMLIVPNEFAAQCGTPNAYSAILLPVCPTTRKTLIALKNDPGIVLRSIKPQPDNDTRARLLAEIEKALAAFPDAVTDKKVSG